MGYIGIYSLTILFHQMEVENKMETGLCRGRQCKGKGNSCNQARARIVQEQWEFLMWQPSLRIRYVSIHSLREQDLRWAELLLLWPGRMKHLFGCL